jgi:FMN-dependent NADH-azoreductase
MAHVLYIKGHPAENSSSSVSLKLAERFIRTYEAMHASDTVSTVDLYSDDIPLIDADVLSAWGKLRFGHADAITPSEHVKLSRLTELSNQFIASDKYIFAAPMWNMGYPPMVKAYIDGAMIVQGKTFAYTDQGPVALLRGQGKKAVILEASGGQYLGTPLAAHTSASHYLKAMLEYIGVDDVTVVTAEGMAQMPDERDAIIAAAETRVAELASTF